MSEAAAELGVPIGTVKSRSHRAHARLVSLLGHVREVSA
jgi:DNA-directed RNA polymerase specialized sigma24 family protein